MSMIATVLGFAQVFADVGVSNAIIYRQDASRDQLSSLYWMNFGVSVLLGAVVVVSAPLVAGFFHQPQLIQPLRVASLLFVVIPVGQQFQVLLQRELEFDRLATIEIVAAVAALAVATVAAVAGQGVYSLIWGQLARATVMSIATTMVGWHRWRPHLHLSVSDLRGFVSFGLYQMGERSINYLAANIDYLLIGRYLGPAQLGVYTIAYNLVVVPLSKLNPVLTKVAFPVFARRQDDSAALRRGFGELVELVALVSFPLLVGLGILAPLAVPAIFGASWQPAAVLVQIMVVMGLIKCLSNPLGALLLALGRADVGFWLNVATMTVTVAVLWAVVGRGTQAVAWAHTAIQIPFFFVELGILRYIIELRPRSYFARLARPTLTTAVMGALVFGMYMLMRSLDVSEGLQIVSLVLAGAAAYAASWQVLAPSYVRGLRRMLSGRSEEPT
jgi:O-antigen/teichoic acid export membrane protein